MRPVIVAPSLLACDFGNLASEIKSAEVAGADWLHLDIMDGHFVDNISFGPAFVQAAYATATVPLDVHLMVSRPDHYFTRFIPFAKNITVHVEAEHDVAQTLQAIRDAGCGVGLTLNPATPFSAVEPYLKQIDLLLVMTVVPGFGGQPFMPEMLEKVKVAATRREEIGANFHIEVDGGIRADTAAACIKAGANVLVAGSSIFSEVERTQAIENLRKADFS